MNLKVFFGLEDSEIRDEEILQRLNDANLRNIDDIEFVTAKGSKVRLHLPHKDFSMQKEPWDPDLIRGTW